ncbi:MAG: hypothetical protein ACO28M_11605 [Vulcanococcus sp.]
MFSPAGTHWCLNDHTDFPAGTSITVPADADYRVGDSVVFAIENGGKVDTAITAGTTYYVVAVAAGQIDVSATKGGAAITLNGDGGTGTADSAGHVNISFAPVDALCGVKEWSLDLSRETVDTTTLPCKVGGAASRYASFRTSQAGFASGEGTMTVVFTSGQGMSNRLLANSMYKNSLATVKLYINAVSGTGGSIDDSTSNYIEAQVSLNGFSVSVNTDDVVEAEIQFTLAAQPKALFGVTL